MRLIINMGKQNIYHFQLYEVVQEQSEKCIRLDSFDQIRSHIEDAQQTAIVEQHLKRFLVLCIISNDSLYSAFILGRAHKSTYGQWKVKSLSIH